MAVEPQHVVSAIQKSKQILFVIHEYLPLPLAFWFPAVVSILKDQGKGVTILVVQETIGWSKFVDAVYPNDMVLQLEQLRQEITFPISGNTVGEVSYAIEAGKLKVTIVPTGEPVDTDHIHSVMQGKSFDQIIAVGVSAAHPVLDRIKQAGSSVNRAEYIFIGTFAIQSALQNRLGTSQAISVVESVSDAWLRQVVTKLVDLSIASETTRELTTLFMHTHNKATHKIQYLDKEAHEFLSKIFVKSLNLPRMGKVFEYNAEKMSRALDLLLASRQVATSNESLILGLDFATRQKYEIEVADIHQALYYLPKYDSLKQVVVIVAETERVHHVFLSGSSMAVRQVATKYGFPMTEHITGGLVVDMPFEKLCHDVTRIVAQEELVPKLSICVYKEQGLGQISAEVESEVEVSPSIPAQPISSETLQKIEELHQGEALDELPKEASTSIEGDEAVEHNRDTYTTPASKQGIDFAAIAKKMRESSN